MNAKPIETEPIKFDAKDAPPITAAPHNLPSPPLDGKKPIPAGEVEKFLVTTDTSGGD